MTKKSVFIVDDSASYRHQLRLAVESMEGFAVVGEASDGRSALQFLKYKEADVMTLDVEMPDMTGIEVVREFRRTNKKCKVIMFSSLTSRGASATLQALSAGADDFVAKPVAGEYPKTLSPSQIIKSLLEPKIKILSHASSTPTPAATPGLVHVPPKSMDWQLFKPKIIVIGSSTGGPTALEKLFAGVKWPLNCPVLISQHLPPLFSKALSERLSTVAGMSVTEARDGEPIKPGKILLAPGDFHLKVGASAAGEPVVRLDQGPQRNFVRPAVDHLFESAAQIYAGRCLGIVLTGMGYDGKEGAEAIKKKMGAVVIQDKASSVVFGMPGAVMESGQYDQMGDLSAIANLINRITKN